MLNDVRTISALLTPGERVRAIWVLFIAMGLAILEAVGVASIMPFLAVLGDPDSIERIAPLRLAYNGLGFDSREEFLIALGVAAVVVLVLAGLYKLVASIVMARFVNLRRHSISRRLLEHYLAQPYAFFLGRNTSELTKGVVSETEQMIGGVLRPLVDLVAQSMVVLLIGAFLVAINPLAALLVGLILGGIYLAVFAFIRRRASRYGRERVEANRRRFRAVAESFGAIKEIKLRGCEAYYLNHYDGPSKRMAQLRTRQTVFGATPRFVLESTAMVVLMAVTLSMIGGERSLGELLPLIGAYAMAGFRLLPAVQKVYANSVSLRFGFAAAQNLLNEMGGLRTIRESETTRSRSSSLALKRRIELRNVSFRYGPNLPPALSDLNVVIPACTSVGIVGTTGAGKTTFVDVLLGLLSPESGEILVDDVPLGPANRAAWQKRVGYVPQSIYLADDTVAANIAFGRRQGGADQAAVQRAAQAAQIADFIESMPESYQSRFGERGVRLSGGQRQRLGIARALYDDPDLLVFDEGTSALDSETEAAIMDAIYLLARRKTIILIAHRISTVRNCDQILVLEQGRVVASGRFEELMERSERFQKLAQGIELPSVDLAG